MGVHMKRVYDKTLQALPIGFHTIGEGETLGLKMAVTESKDGARLNKQFVFQYRWKYPHKTVTHRLGLGGYPTVSLKQARDLAREARSYLSEKPKRNPKDVWRAAAQERDGMISFGQAAEDYMDAKLKQYKNEKHKQQWRNTLTTYAAPIWDVSVKQIGIPEVLQCVEPIWETKTETARRLRGRIEAVLDAAKVKGYREGDNPAAWKGNLKSLLPDMADKQKHHAAMPWVDCPDFVQRLISHNSTASKALALIILTGLRSSEGRGALWSEIDMERGIWTIPAQRMKKPREHIVPLSKATIAILKSQIDTRQNDTVFWTGKAEISGEAIQKLLRQTLKIPAEVATIHGFRSSFRDWAGETTHYSREIVEISLAHQFGDATERAYRRTEYIERRRPLMEDWGAFLSGASKPKIIQFPSKG